MKTQSTGDYPFYNALWHLEKIGVLDLEQYKSDAWDYAAARSHEENYRTSVALIDNSVATSHPNLRNCIDKNTAIDFFSARLGAFPLREQDDTKQGLDKPFSPDELKKGDITSQLAKQTGAETIRLYTDLVQRLERPNHRQSAIKPTTNENFSAHGTAMAGLIAARPLKYKPKQPTFLGTVSEIAKQQLRASETVLPYAGVDPYCTLIPISTSFDPDPEQLILALLYASAVGADVIVLARDFYDPERTSVSESHTNAGKVKAETDIASSIARASLDGNTKLWRELEALIVALSQRVPILCAAGNGADERLIYPASLSTDKNGIIPIGARTASGKVAAYSSLTTPGAVYAPSGDGERLDKGLSRLDTISAGFEKGLHSSDYVNKLVVDDFNQQSLNAYSTLNLISTDVPGDFGYNGSEVAEDPTDEEITDFGSYYCEFSGTSGAVAVAAGFLSLIYSSGILPRNTETSGTEAKDVLKKASTPTAENTNAFIIWTRVAGEK